MGIIVGEEITCNYFPGEITPNITFEENEVIVNEKECSAIKTKLEGSKQPDKPEKREIGSGTTDAGFTGTSTSSTIDEISEIQITFEVPRGQVSQIMGLMNFLQQKYQKLSLQIGATDGTMTDGELSDHVKETLKQLGINPDRAVTTRK